MPKPRAVHNKQHSSLMIRCASASLAAGVLYLLTRGLDCHILPATEFGAATLGRDTAMSMEPFSKIVHCAPFNVMITPNADYKVAVNAEEDVKAAVSPIVHGDTLHLEVKQGFRTDKPIKVEIGLPRDKLQSVRNQAPESDIAVSEGFKAQRFTATNTGSGNILFRGLDAQEATFNNNGCVTFAVKTSCG